MGVGNFIMYRTGQFQDLIMDTTFRMFGDDASMMLTLHGVSGDRDACLRRRWRWVRVHGSVKRRAAGISHGASGGCGTGSRSLRGSSFKAARTHRRLYPETLRLQRHQGHEGAAQAAGAGRHLRSARGRLFLSCAHRACASGLRSPRCCSRPATAARCIGWWSAPPASSAMWGRASISTAGSRTARPSIAPAFPISWTCSWSAPMPACRMEAALDRVGRELGDSYPSLTRQHPHGQSGNPRRPHV